MAAHRYWRLELPPLDIGNGVQLSEVQVRTALGGADVSASATKSSSFGATLTQIFDGNNSTETYFFAGGDPAKSLWIAFDFGAPVELVEVLIRSGTNGGLAPAWMRVRYSDDGVQWSWTAPAFEMAGMGASTVFLASGFTPAVVVDRAVGAALRVSPGVASGPSGARVFGQVMRNDLADGGAYRVAGTVAIDGTPATPVRRRVRLFHRLTGRFIREVWSATDGTFSFEKIALAEYVVLSDDYNRVYNAVVADAVVSVP